MSKPPADPYGKVPRGGGAGKSPGGRKDGYGSGRDTKGPGKNPGSSKPGGRDK